MDTTNDRLDAHLTGDPAGWDRLSAQTEAFAARHALPPAVTAALSLCLDELIANALTHGGAQHIHVTATLTGDTLGIRIEDDGAPFDPFTDAPPPILDGTIDDRPPGGLGILLVRQSVTGAHHQREDGRNVVTLTMRAATTSSPSRVLPPPAPAEEGRITLRPSADRRSPRSPAR